MNKPPDAQVSGGFFSIYLVKPQHGLAFRPWCDGLKPVTCFGAKQLIAVLHLL